MAFLDDIDRKLTRLSQGAVQKTKELTDTAKISGAIKDLEYQKNNAYAELGKVFYQQYGQHAVGDVKRVVDRIDQLDVEINAYKDQMKSIKGIVYCPNCNSEIPANSLFCNVCGAKIEQPQKIPVSGNQRVCSKCGCEVAENQLFCVNCGNKLEEVPENAAVPKDIEKESEIPAESLVDEQQSEIETVIQNKCINCGEEYEEGQVFCTNCGNKVR